MVGLLISMKLRVLRNSLRGAAAFAFVMGGLVGLGVAVACVVLVATHPGGISVGTDIASAFFAIWMLGWLFGPVVTGGGDETLRPENFALLPIRPHQLAVGLLGASLAGVAPIVSILVFCSLVVVAIPGGFAATVVAVVAVVAQLALVVLLSRVVIAGIGALLGSRRGKDLGVLLGALVGLAYLPARAAFEQLGPIVVGQTSPAFTLVLRALPSGWGPSAVAAAAEHNWLQAMGWLLALAGLDAVLVVAWSRLLVRRMTMAASAAGPSRARRREGHAPRRSLLPDTPTGAVIGKELTMWWRDAQRRTLLLTSILIGLLLPAFSIAQGGGFGGLSLSALWMVVFAAMQVSNLYGLDGTAVWQTLIAPDAVQADVRGRQWAWALIVGPVALIAAAVLPAVTGATDMYPVVFALVPVLLGAGAGTMLLASVDSPYPAPSGKGRNPFGSGQSAGGFAKIGRRLVLTTAQMAAAIPVGVLLVLGMTGLVPAATWVAIPVGIACGIGAAWWWGQRAFRHLELRGPELLAAIRVPA